MQLHPRPAVNFTPDPPCNFTPDPPCNFTPDPPCWQAASPSPVLHLELDAASASVVAVGEGGGGPEVEVRSCPSWDLLAQHALPAAAAPSGYVPPVCGSPVVSAQLYPQPQPCLQP